MCPSFPYKDYSEKDIPLGGSVQPWARVQGLVVRGLDRSHLSHPPWQGPLYRGQPESVNVVTWQGWVFVILAFEDYN